MITIFEKETEVGRCTYEPADNLSFQYEHTEFSTIYAHTVATVNGHRGLLKIEQHCYLRHDTEIPDQPWIKPEVTLDPVIGSRQEMIAMAQQQHEKFIERIHQEFPHEYLTV